jgi:1-deoxy-D-xylulose-5-phosphate synthase
MSICPRVGGLAESLDRLRTAPFYTELKNELQRFLSKVPLLGDPVERFISQLRDAIKAGLLGGMFFEDLGFRYIGPVDGHNIRQLQRYLAMVRGVTGPVLLHVVTEKGHGFQPAAEDPTSFHAPAPFVRERDAVVAFKRGGGRSYTEIVRETLLELMQADQRVVVITAAMCQGHMLEPIRDGFPQRFFDVGICESHAVAFAAGLAKAGMRPYVAIYSTFLQRSYDQLFQEVALQNLPIVLLLDRAGLVGADGPTHHGVFDLTYLRPLPNMAVLVPGDEFDTVEMLRFTLQYPGPVAIRYPKARAESLPGERTPFEFAQAEVLREGIHGALIGCGTLVGECLEAAEQLAAEGLRLGVINARCVKPLDAATLLGVVEHSPFVLSVEEGALMGGFGGALLEAASDAGLDTARVRRLGIPDKFIEHAERHELLADLGLTAQGIADYCRQLAETYSLDAHSENNRFPLLPPESRRPPRLVPET